MNKHQAERRAKHLSLRENLEGLPVYLVHDGEKGFDAATEDDLLTFYQGLRDSDICGAFVNGQFYN